MRGIGGTAGQILRLAVADLRHDWVLTLCVVFALSAVISPLLLILGLKFGTIETLRSRLLQNPSNLEIRPLSSVRRGSEWFQKVAERSDVSFVIPMTRQIAATVQLRRPGERTGIDVDLIPTGEGDRVLATDSVSIPNEHQIVLTSLAAESLGVKAGDSLSLIVTRSRGRDLEQASLPMEVCGVLSQRSSGVKGAFALLRFLEFVEAYKDGLAVPEFGVEGQQPIAQPVYDGAIILTAQRLTEEQSLRLAVNTGFGKVTELSGAELLATAGWSAVPLQNAYHAVAGGATVDRESFIAVTNQLRGQEATIIPWIRPLEVLLSDAAGDSDHSSIKVYALSLPDVSGGQRFEPEPPWGKATTKAKRFSILLPSARPAVDRLLLTFSAAGRPPLSIPVHSINSLPASTKYGLVPAEIAGVLRASVERPVRFDAASGEILVERATYSSFRMYARTIDGIEGIRRYLAEEGISVHTESQRIGEVITLDRHLTRIFWLIATVGIGGGIAALVASLYASVERKRHIFGVLRLLGFSKRELLRFPVYQGTLMGAASVGSAFALYAVFAVTINSLFKDQLQAGEAFCAIPTTYQIGATILVLLLALVSASGAAWRVNRTTPADAIRGG